MKKIIKKMKIFVLAIFVLCPVFAMAQKTKEVEAIGYGNSRENAIADAQKEAVAKVVASFVGDKTTLINGVLHTETIIANAGLVEKYDIIEEYPKKADGTHSLKIRAVVRYDKLLSPIRPDEEEPEPIDVKALEKAIKDKQMQKEANSIALAKAQEQMGKFLLKVVDDYVGLWYFEKVNVIPNSNDNTISIEISKTLSKDDYVSGFLQILDKKFQGIGIVPSSGYSNGSVSVNVYDIYAKKIAYHIDLFKMEQLSTNKKFLQDKLAEYNYVLKVELKDAKDEVLSESYIALNNINSKRFDSIGLRMDANNIPIIINPTFRGSKAQENKSFKIKLYSPAKVENITTCSVELIKVDPRAKVDFKW